MFHVGTNMSHFLQYQWNYDGAKTTEGRGSLITQQWGEDEFYKKEMASKLLSTTGSVRKATAEEILDGKGSAEYNLCGILLNL